MTASVHATELLLLSVLGPVDGHDRGGAGDGRRGGRGGQPGVVGAIAAGLMLGPSLPVLLPRMGHRAGERVQA